MRGLRGRLGERGQGGIGWSASGTQTGGRFGVYPALGLFLLLLFVPLVGGPILFAAQKEVRREGALPSPPSAPPSVPPTIRANGSSPHFERIVGGKFIENQGAYQFVYTVNPVLQASVEETFRKRRPPFGVFVALEPKSGKILALAEYARPGQDAGEIWNRATFPAASVFKIITAACALENGSLNYDSSVSFRGNQYRLGPNKVSKPSKWDQQTQFDDALGKSNNVVFGRVASALVGSQALREYSEAFGFNQPIPFDFPVDSSKAVIPEQKYELARCGAGFGEVTLNPLHGALIAAAVANQGVMMRPYVIETVRNGGGEVLYEARRSPWAQPVSPRTAKDLNRMMRRTVEDGTASRTFQRYGKEFSRKVTVSGKTGSLSGDNPPGLYDWFVGFSPAEDPEIAFAAMVISYQGYPFRGAFFAQQALKTFFRSRLE